ncbi:hypothetical protein CBL_10091 [Carabus blaptoides fortunei]
MVFWNTVGIKGWGNDFWDYIKEFDFIGLTETWIEENQWIKIQKDLPQGCKWTCRFAKRAHKKGRAMGGILTGVRDDIAENERHTIDTDNIQERNIIAKNSAWKILTVYNNGKIKDKHETLTRDTEVEELIQQIKKSATSRKVRTERTISGGTQNIRRNKLAREVLQQWKEGKDRKDNYLTQRTEFRQLCKQRKLK